MERELILKKIIIAVHKYEEAFQKLMRNFHHLIALRHKDQNCPHLQHRQLMVFYFFNIVTYKN